MPTPYAPIGDYGLIGNMITAALVGMDGSIDWLCLPRFDSPSVFGALLDAKKGGRFRIAPVEEVQARKQFYWPDTNVLVTRFFVEGGVGQVTDYMPVGIPKDCEGYRWLVREVRVIRGSVRFRLDCRPAPNYGQDDVKALATSSGVSFVSANARFALESRLPLQVRDGAASAEFTLGEEERSTVVFRDEAESGCPPAPDFDRDGLFHSTVDYWHRWLSRCHYQGRWREVVQRSALTLKLLTYEPSGAIIAAPTCSLPEAVGGVRNWDYRFSWIRDAAFTLYAFMRIGFTEEAARYMDWIDRRCHEAEGRFPLPVMFTIDGRPVPEEVTIEGLEGYRGSRPVRVGNLAARQFQLDIYGDLMDAVYLYNKYGAPISYDLWVHLRAMLDWLSEAWRRPDAGIWEVRGPLQHFVYSKLLCWVALDRGLRLADKRSFPADVQRWRAARDAIYEEIMTRGWNEELGTFVQAYDSRALDAATLMMPMVFFVSPTDPMMLSTLKAIDRRPSAGGLVSSGLVNRYDTGVTDDGLPGGEGSFNLCTLWLIEAMTRAGREDASFIGKARLLFEQMLGYANHLGLYAEQTGPNGEALGNFPQAFTHLALISAAFNLDRALGGQRGERTERTPVA
ncbi:MAG TPA: glycoside hydrolase family 15 protein [Planctomycetota bacterium]|nr:glycoside hydrolase family 15 protein [Planctomycetota bacterium]